jgi:hypothetical protein
VSNDVEGLVTTCDQERHDLEDGAFVTFSEVKGMTELNGKQFKIKVIGMKFVLKLFLYAFLFKISLRKYFCVEFRSILL